jgi:hypothetical protein
VFDDGNRLQPNLHYAMDYEFFLRLADAGYKIRHIPYVLADFRMHPESKSCSRELVQAREKREIMRSLSSIGRRVGSPLLRHAAFMGLQWTASVMRYSEKMLRGYYFRGTVQEGGAGRGVPPTA